MEHKSDQSQRGCATRQALIEAGCLLFGQKGFYASSTREIAKAAGANQALIGFHFGGKDGLYSAVLDHVERQLYTRLMPSAGMLRDLKEAEETADEKAVCLLAIGEMIDNLVDTLIDPELEAWVRVILQGQQEDDSTHERIFANFAAPHFNFLLGLISRVRPDFRETENRLTTVILIGQILAFRPAQSLILKHMHWADFGSEQIHAIKKAVRANLPLPFALPT